MKEESDYSNAVSPTYASLPEETMSTQENRVDSTVQMEQEGERKHFQKTLKENS